MATPDDPSSVRRLRPWVRAVRVLGLGVGLVAGLVAGILGAVQIDAVGTWVVRRATGALAPAGLAVSVSRVSGSWLGSLRVADLQVNTEDGTPVVAVDTLHLDYRLWPLLRRHVDVEAVTLSGGDLRLARREDGSLGLAGTRAAPPPPAPTRPAPANPWTVSVADLRVDRLSGTLRSPPPSSGAGALPSSAAPATVFSWEEVGVHLRDFVVEDGLSVTLDSLRGRFDVPSLASDDVGPVDFEAVGSLTPRRLVIDALQLRGPGSRLVGAGTLGIPSASARAAPLTFDLALERLPLALVHAALGNPPDDTARLDGNVAVTGTTRRPSARVELRVGDARVAGSVAFSLGDDTGERYAADLEITALDPAALTGDPARAGRIEGRVDVELEGPSREALGGHAHVWLDRIALSGVPLRSAGLESEWTAGTAQADVRIDADVGALGLSGTIRPLDTTPSWDLEGPVEAVFPGEGRPLGRVTGRIGLRGEGIELDSARAVATLALSEVEVRGGRLDAATLRGSLAEGSVDWTLDARDAGTGRVAAAGVLDPAAPTAFRVDSAVVRDFDLAGFLGDSVEGRLDARLSASGEAASLEEIVADLSVSVHQARYGTLRVDSAGLTARLAEGLVGGALRARAPAGSTDAAFTARPFTEVPVMELRRLDFADVDVGALGPPPEGSDVSPPLATRLTGRVEGTLRGRSPETLGAELRLRLDTSAVNRQVVSDAEGELTLVDGVARLRLDAAFADGGLVQFDIQARPFLERPTFRVDRLDFSEVEPFLLATATSGGTTGARLTGTASGEATGLDPRTLDADLEIRLGPSRFNRSDIEEARIDLRARGGRLEATADARLAGGEGAVRAHAILAGDSTTYALDATLRTRAPGRLLADGGEGGNLDAALVVEGRGTDPATMDARLRLTADDSRLGALAADTVRVGARLHAGVVHVDTLRVRSNVVDVGGGGALALFENGGGTPSDLTLEAVVTSLAPLQDWIEVSPLGLGTGRLEVTVTGPAQALHLRGGMEASAARVGATELAGLSSRFESRLGPDRTVVAAEGQLDLDRLTMGGIGIRASRVDVAWEGPELNVTGLVTVDDRREARFSVRGDPRPPARTMSVERLDLRIDDDRWSLVGVPSIAWSEGLAVDRLDLRAEGQSLFVDGRLDPTGESDLRARVEAFRLGGVTDLFGLDRLDGVLTTGLTLRGSGADPRIEADVAVDLEAAGGARSTLSGALGYSRSRLELDGAIRADGGGAITISGGVPLDLTLDPGARADSTGRVTAAQGEVDLAIRADGFDLHWAEPFLDPISVRDLFGDLDIDARVTGTQASPVLSGSARLREGRLRLPALGVTYEGATADITLDGGVARLDSARVGTGDGTLRLDGTLALPELSLGEFAIRARLDRFRAVHNTAFNVRVSGEAALGGTTTAPRVEGDLRLVEADIYLDEVAPSGASVRPVELTEAQLRELEEYLGFPVRRPEREAGALFEALTLDVAVSVSRDTWVRQRANPELEIQLSGALTVEKQPQDSLRFDGRIETVARRSWVEQFGRRFRIEEGVVDLQGTAAESRIDVRAVYEVPSTRDGRPEATITLDIEGTLEELSLTLGSEPVMENADIVSYLATGRPAASSLDFEQGGAEGGGLRGMGSEFALGQVTGLVEGLAAQGAGLDVVEIRTDGLRGATLIAGRFVTPEVYVGFKQPVGRDADDPDAGGASDRTQVELEIQALRWLLLNMEASNSAVSFLFRFRHAY